MRAIDDDAANHAPEDALGFLRHVYRLSNEAFALAQQAAQDGFHEEHKRHARELEARLRELWPAVQAAAVNDPTLPGAWNDGVLDASYVHSEGTMAQSIRLHHYLQEGSGEARPGRSSEAPPGTP